MTDRDHFAAAAFAGLLAQGDDGSFSEESYARAAYRWADAMLRERDQTARKMAESGSVRAVSTNHDAAPAAKATADRYVRRAAADGDSDRTDKAATRPSEGTGDPCAPPPHATPPQGSVQGAGSFRDSRFAIEPVAWAVAGDYGEYAVKLCFDEASAVLEADRRCRVGLRPDYVVVPLYRHPQPTLTRDERDAVEWITKTLRLTIGPDRLVTLRGLVERLK